jgi:hypothetical protein
VREEFGLEIKIHDFTESLSNEEIKLAEIRKIELDEMGKQQGHILMSETDELTTLLEKKRMLLEVGDDEEEVKKIDNAILAIKNKSSFSKDKFLGQRTNNDFLIPPIDSPNDTSEHVKKDTPIE